MLRLLNVLQRGLLSILAFFALCVGCGRNERMDALYAQRCLSCHGLTGSGDGPMAAALPARPPDFRDTVQRKSNSQIRKIIADGAGVMPAFGPALSPSEINDMLQMVRFLSREGRDVAWWEKFDTLVVAHCSVPWEAVLGYDEPTGPQGR
ncbi:MAG: c-type cytochrome [Candidatus Binatia bacterium]